MTKIFEVMPPSWVELGTYIHEDFAEGEINSWWNSEFRNAWSVDQEPGDTDHTICQRNATGASAEQLTPAGAKLTGDFTLDVRCEYGEFSGSPFRLEVRKFSDDSLVCAIGIDGSNLRWLYSPPSTKEDISVVGFADWDRFWLRMKRVGSTIFAYWYDDFNIGAGTFSFQWTAFANTVTSTPDDVYLTTLGADYGGFAELRLQADTGFAYDISPNATVNGETMDKCFHLGLKPEQGGGWDECEDGDWVWPMNQACVMTVIDTNGNRRLVVYDRHDGIRYILNTKDGPPGSGLVWRNKDKVDPNVSGSGADIPSRLKLRQHYGEKTNYTMDHVETSIDIEPRKMENVDATGYDSNGMLDGQQFDAYIYRNGEETYAARAIDIPLDREIVFDRKTPGTPLQLEIQTVKSDWRITGFEHHFTVYDVPKFPKRNSNDISMQATQNQAALRTPIFWMSRSASRPLVNRSTTRVLTPGSSSGVTGPDGQSNSGQTLTP